MNKELSIESNYIVVCNIFIFHAREINGSKMLLIAEPGDEGLREAMADPSHLRAVQREQRHAMDTIQYYSEYCDAILPCYKFPCGHDKHDIYDNVYTADISG